MSEDSAYGRETPDFERIARRIASAIPSVATRETVEYDVARQLRMVWNARGAEDCANVKAALSSMMGVTVVGSYLSYLERTFRRLDR